MYVQVLNDTYGTLKAEPSFKTNISKDIVEQDFITNPYGICVANKIINSCQMTVGYRVDDTKIPHKIPQGIYVIIEDFKTKYQDKIGKMKFPRGEVYEYLGTTMDYRMIGELNIYTTNYVKKTIKEYPAGLSTNKITPTSDFILKTNNNSDHLKDQHRQCFHITLVRAYF